MPFVPIDDERPNPNVERWTFSHWDTIAILALLSTLLLLYVIVAGFANSYISAVVPSGDHVPYSTNLFNIINASKDQYLATISGKISSGSPYFLMYSLAAIFGPILNPSLPSIIFLNFINVFFALCVIYVFARFSGLKQIGALAGTLLILASPWNYGLRIQSSMMYVSPDHLFLFLQFVAAAALIAYAVRPKRRLNAVLAGLATALALWGRGNSFPYILVLMHFPVIICAYRAYRSEGVERRRMMINLAIFFAVFLTMAGYYYYLTFDSIFAYYSLHNRVTTAKDFELGLIGMKWMIKNLPGVFFTGARDTQTTHMVSYAVHVLMVLSVVVAFVIPLKSRRDIAFARSLTLSMTATYFGLFAMAFVAFPTMFTYAKHRPTHALIALLVPLTFNIFFYLWLVARPIERNLLGKFKFSAIPLLCVGALYAGFFFTGKFTQTSQPKYMPGPLEINKVSLDMHSIVQNRKITYLFYASMTHFNLFNYYLTQAKLPPIRPYFGAFGSLANLLVATTAPEKIFTYEQFSEKLRKTLAVADFLVIPENIKDFTKFMGLSPLVYHRRAIPEYLNDPSLSQDYIVRLVVNIAPGSRVLLLERAPNSMLINEDTVDLFPRDYGTDGQKIGRVFPHALNYGIAATNTKTVPKAQAQGQPNNPFGPENLFMTGRAKFWEINTSKSGGSGPNKKAQLLITSRTPWQMVRYAFMGGPAMPDASLRLPRKWRVEASGDGKQWQILDNRHDQTDWQKSEKRTFDLSNDQAFKYYRFVLMENNYPKKNPIFRIYEMDMWKGMKNGSEKLMGLGDIYISESVTP